MNQSWGVACPVTLTASLCRSLFSDHQMDSAGKEPIQWTKGSPIVFGRIVPLSKTGRPSAGLLSSKLTYVA
jgi:hypothetical protein